MALSDAARRSGAARLVSRVNVFVAAVALMAGIALGRTAASSPTPGNATPGVNQTPAAPVSGAPAGAPTNASGPPTNTSGQTATSRPPAGGTSTEADGRSGIGAALSGIGAFVSGLAQNMSWAFASLIVLLLLRKEVGAVARAIVEAMGDRGVTLDVGTVKVSVTERAQEGIEDVRPIFLASPFEVGDEAWRDDALELIAPQVGFFVSDTVARFWEGRPGGAEAVAKMRTALSDLKNACEAPDVAFTALRPLASAYAKALGAARFRDAHAFAALTDKWPGLANGLENIRRQSPFADDDLRMLLAASVAFAQAGAWERSLAFASAIAWDDKKEPRYAPAAAVWLAASYHHQLDTLARKTPELSFDSQEVRTLLDSLADDGKRLIAALAAWTPKDGDPPKGYLLREAHKDLGQVLTLVAEHISDLDKRGALLELGCEQLRMCIEPLPGDEVPSALDHNNLADAYRQLGDLARKRGAPAAEAQAWYREARAEMDEAFKPERPGDPAYHHTLALILHSEGNDLAGYQVLSEYPGALARDAGAQYVEQYLDNQVLAAKLVVAQHGRGDARGVDAAARVLQDAAAYLSDVRGLLTESSASRLELQIRELLGFAYLQMPRCEAGAVTEFRRVMTLTRDEPNPALMFRRRIGFATALARRARILRRQSAVAQGVRLLEEARPLVIAACDHVDALTIDAATPPAQREARLRRLLDAVRTTQLLAEEHFAAHESAEAETLAKRVAAPLAALSEKLQRETGHAAEEMRAAARRVAARHALLGARQIVRADPRLGSSDTVRKVEQMVDGARGVSAEFDCQAALELGGVLLTSARLGKGDPFRDYQAALIELERAIEPDAPALRSEAIRQLSMAYAMRGAILRKARASASTTQ